MYGGIRRRGLAGPEPVVQPEQPQFYLPMTHLYILSFGEKKRGFCSPRTFKN